MKEPKEKPKPPTEAEYITFLICNTETELNKHRDIIKSLMKQKELLYNIKKKL